MVRLRHAKGRPQADDGIFILGSSLVDENEKYGRQRHRCNAVVATFGGIVMIATVLVLNGRPQTLLTTSIGGGVDNGNATSHKQPPSYPSTSDKHDTAPSNERMRGSSPPRIPRRLIFTNKYNLIAPSKNDPPFNGDDPLTANVLRTVGRYREYWDAEDAAERSRSSPSEASGKNDEMVVSFLSDDDCVAIITEAEPRLVEKFRGEKRGEFKGDICRVAELYVYGGYCFDIDIGVYEPLHLDDLHLPRERVPDITLRYLKMATTDELMKLMKGGRDDLVTFSTVVNKQGRFFQAFTAAMPRHPVMERSLQYMVAYYDGTLEQVLPQDILDRYRKQVPPFEVPSRTKPNGMGLGPYTMSVAYNSIKDDVWEQYIRDVMKDHGYVSENGNVEGIEAKRRYSRFLYEISLQWKELEELGLFRDIPLQDAEYKKKVQWCNFVCVDGDRVYFYSRVPGSRGCPLEKK
jgi:hypothetical protein